MSVEVWQTTPPRPYRFELLPEEAMASALELLDQPLGEGGAEKSDGALDRAVARGLESAMAFADRQARERQAALVLLSSLVRLPPAERRQHIAEHRPRFHSGELCRLLIDKAADEADRDMAASREFGALAVFAAEQLDDAVPAAIRHDQLTEIWSAVAGHRRLAGDLEGAAAALERAAAHLAQGSGTLMVRADYLLAKASLAGDREELKRGLRYADQALCILRAGAGGAGIARGLLAKARLELGAGRPAAALPLLEEARRSLGESPDRALQLAVHQHLAFVLGELDRLGEARLSLRVAQASAKLLGRPAAGWRLRWLEGRLAFRAEAPDAGRGALREAHRGLRRAGHRAAAGLVGLDLCRRHLASRRFVCLAVDLRLLAVDPRLLTSFAGTLLRRQEPAGASGETNLERRLRYAVLDRAW